MPSVATLGVVLVGVDTFVLKVDNSSLVEMTSLDAVGVLPIEIVSDITEVLETVSSGLVIVASVDITAFVDDPITHSAVVNTHSKVVSISVTFNVRNSIFANVLTLHYLLGMCIYK